jgi:hypothetical protein
MYCKSYESWQYLGIDRSINHLQRLEPIMTARVPRISKGSLKPSERIRMQKITLKRIANHIGVCLRIIRRYYDNKNITILLKNIMEI